MENKKNKPPVGVLVAIGVIILMIIGYLVLTSIFPEIFESLSPKQE